MKHGVMFVVLISGHVISFGMEHDAKQQFNVVNLFDDQDDELHNKIVRTPKYPTIKKSLTVGLYLLFVAGAGAGIATIAQSVHHNRSVITLPYNETLPQNSNGCIYKYGSACEYSLLENQQDCNKKCSTDEGQDGCPIIKTCEEVTYDRQIVPGIVITIIDILGFIGKSTFDIMRHLKKC